MVRDFKPSAGDASTSAQVGEGPPGPGKHSLIESTLVSHGGAASAAVQRKPSPSSAASPGGSPDITPPTGGINKTGFIDNGDGANIRTGPSESGGQKVRDRPLPPATRVFVSGTHPTASAWWYVTAYLDGTMVRGYVQNFRVTTELPEPTAKLHQVVSGETAERLAAQEYGSAVRDGHDLRYYENVLLHVNQEKGRDGITGSYQVPGILGGGSNNVQLIAGHRIWLVSPAYAKALEAVVPSGSLTGGGVAKVKRFAGHLEDILHSVTGSPQHFGEVAGEYAQAIRDHMPAIVGIVAGFITAEALSAFLAAVPTGVSQIAAVVIQLGLSAFGAAGAIQAGAEALKHAVEWLTLAWTAQGKEDRVAAASKEFLKMLVAIAIAALSALGARANYGNALKIASSMPTGALPAMAIAGGGQVGAGARAGVLIGPGTGSLGTAGNAMMQADKDGGSADHPKATDDNKSATRTEGQQSENNSKSADSAESGNEPIHGAAEHEVPENVRTLRAPASRHWAAKVSQKTVAKGMNTVIEPGVDVAADVAEIQSGRVPKVKGNYTVNGRTYGVHEGTLFPISGAKLHQLNRGAFQALGVLNKFGDTSQARAILAQMQNVGPSEIDAALQVWRSFQ